MCSVLHDTLLAVGPISGLGGFSAPSCAASTLPDFSAPIHPLGWPEVCDTASLQATQILGLLPSCVSRLGSPEAPQGGGSMRRPVWPVGGSCPVPHPIPEPLSCAGTWPSGHGAIGHCFALQLVQRVLGHPHRAPLPLSWGGTWDWGPANRCASCSFKTSPFALPASVGCDRVVAKATAPTLCKFPSKWGQTRRLSGAPAGCPGSPAPPSPPPAPALLLSLPAPPSLLNPGW